MGAGDQQALADRLHLGSLCAHTRGASQSQHTDAQAERSTLGAVWAQLCGAGSCGRHTLYTTRTHARRHTHARAHARKMRAVVWQW
jgi:hypothetical protein